MMNRKIFVPASVLILVALIYVLGWSSFFTVSSVQVTGTVKPIVTGIMKGEKLARVEPREIVSRIEKLSWVESARVSRNWIDGTVEIRVSERTPIAIYNSVVIDSFGKSFPVGSKSPSGLLRIQAGSLEAAVNAVSFLTELPSELTEQMTTIKVRQSGSLVFDLINNGNKLEVRWGSNSDNDLKMKVYQALLALPENKNIKRIDVSAPRAPIVK